MRIGQMGSYYASIAKLISSMGFTDYMITPVLLAGGSGTRLWPLSRELFPKQFLPLTGEKSLLQATATRLSGLDLAQWIVVCGEEHRFVVAEQLRVDGVEHPHILLEPAGRDTAPAIASAALEAIYNNSDDPILLVLPSDHVITDAQAFQSVVKQGAQQAAAGQLVTFGIVPDAPATGYGYILASSMEDGVNKGCESPVLTLECFVEKPDASHAQQYLDAGGYFWNSGMFMFRARDYLSRLAEHAPAIHAACVKAHANAYREQDFIRLEEEAFLASPKDSIDYAVMEKTVGAVLLPLDAGWSDLGSWDAVAEAAGADSQGNVEQGDVVGMDNSNCLLRSEQRLVTAIGLHNQVVIETADAVLVADKSQLQKVKTLVQRLKEQNREEVSNHRKVQRPWGSYETLAEGPQFKVKRIIVHPGQSLSLQMHNKRAEHWVVVRGVAQVTCGEASFELVADQSTYIPLQTRHRLANTSEASLELIEVQSGSYLGEDDIIRYDDDYGRGAA